jgi:pilus assembly protein CpaC
MERPMNIQVPLIAFAFACFACSGVHGQNAEALNGFKPMIPVIPTRAARAAEGADEQQQWSLEAGQPVAGFIDSLNKNDAAIRIVAEQSRLLKLKKAIASEGGTALVAVGDPTILDFNILPNPRVIRLLGLRPGVTDLTITTSDTEIYNFEVHVGWDLDLLTAKLRQTFPNARLKLGQMREHLIVEGQARDGQEVTKIVQMIGAYLASVQPTKKVDEADVLTAAPPAYRPTDGVDEFNSGELAGEEQVNRPEKEVKFAAAQIINLIRVPGIQQVMLQVRVAELNRTALREIGADWLYRNDNGTTIGTNIAGAASIADDNGFLQGLTLGNASTAFGIFPSADLSIVLRALRRNSILNVLAEPNLIAMSGHTASFLAGGQFPVPVPQGGFGNSVTIEFKDFGVQLDFTPFVQADGRIRLHVAPEVSSIDFSLGTVLVPGGTPVPGINARKAETTVELEQGHTLAIAGLLQVDLEARTDRIPGLGDLPYLGPFFSNTSHERVEKELVVMVTPFFVAPIEPGHHLPLPGEEVEDPDDLEFYLLNRIEGRTGCGFRATTAWDDPLGCVERMELERNNIQGPVGHSPF